MAWGVCRARTGVEPGNYYFASWSVRKKLLFSLIPPIMLILVVAGYATNWFSTRYLNQALQRTAQTQNLAQARDIEQTLDYYRVALLDLARRQPDRERMLAAAAQWDVHHPGTVRELGFVGVNNAEATLFLRSGDRFVEPGIEQITKMRGAAVSQALKLHGLKVGSVSLSDLTEAVYPATQPGGRTQGAMVVYRMFTPVEGPGGEVLGYLLIGLDAHVLRNILSLYNSPKSPLYAFARTSETRFSYFFDDQGWILFQSENLEESDRDLSAEVARLGMTGDYGTAEFDKAFRPLPKHEAYWRMIVTVQSGRSGVDDVDLPSETEGFLTPKHFVVYAPVYFLSNPDKGPEVIGGIAYVDRSRLTDAAEFRHLDVMLIITITGMGLVTMVIFSISHTITKPMHKLAAEIRQMFEEKTLRPVRIDSYDMESVLLKNAINRMIDSIKDKQEQIRRRDEQIQKVQQREKVSFDDEVPAALGWRLVGEIPDLIGQSQLMINLQSMIRKAAGTEADVLIVGETGTGKELAAEGIHKFSNRSEKPFISINCGGLDENLLMDTLFGHVKGAFTEARSDRKGAFLASDGGTLFLDEIGTASDKVQKALLRALSVRRIRPLGSDQELEFNTRVIAATNVDLMELAQRGEFREDLYYRLKVITIQTPPLRNRREDIPVLANHFLKDLVASLNRKPVGLSRGGLEKLMNHHWPGNVRELKNCITRAMAFADSDVLYAEDLVFDDATVLGTDTAASPVVEESQMFDGAEVRQVRLHGYGPDAGDAARAEQPRIRREADDLQPARQSAKESAGATPGGRPGPTDTAPSNPSSAASREVNPRASIALRLAREKGSFSRLDYQKAVGADISQRTAQYDLQQLVRTGQLRKQGRGPSTVYLPG